MLYKISFEVLVDDPDMAYRLQDQLRQAGMHIERYNMEAIHDGIQHVHTMEGNIMAVPDRTMNRPYRNTRERFSQMSQEDIEEYARAISRDMDNDRMLDELLSNEAVEKSEEKPKDFLDEKDMEL